MQDVLTSIAATIQTLDQVAGVQVVLEPRRSAPRMMGATGFRDDPAFFGRLSASRERGARLASAEPPGATGQWVLPDRKQRMLAAPEWTPMHDYLRQIEWRDYLSTPLEFGGERGGVINAYLAPDASVTDELLGFFRGIAGLTARAVGGSPVDIPGFERLTARERDVLTALGDGLSNRELGIRLGIAERTAQTHVSNVLVKLDLASRTQAALLATRAGL